MQAVSRESYAAATARLEAYGRDAQPSAIEATADELVEVARLLAGEPRLRRALSDPARDGQARVGLLRELLRGKVSGDAADLLAEIVGAQVLPGLLEPDDLAAPYLFLASDGARDMTGQALMLDRGEVMA
jgi:NAD(P)-dependent dehydrogenase (short-subunit alcohol dehydrogenase family)